MDRFQYLLIKLAESSAKLSKNSLETSIINVGTFHSDSATRIVSGKNVTDSLLDIVSTVMILENEFNLDFNIRDVDLYDSVLLNRLDTLNKKHHVMCKKRESNQTVTTNITKGYKHENV